MTEKEKIKFETLKKENKSLSKKLDILMKGLNKLVETKYFFIDDEETIQFDDCTIYEKSDYGYKEVKKLLKEMEIINNGN